jgi:hypothetical protein
VSSGHCRPDSRGWKWIDVSVIAAIRSPNYFETSEMTSFELQWSDRVCNAKAAFQIEEYSKMVRNVVVFSIAHRFDLATNLLALEPWGTNARASERRGSA